MSSTEGNQEPMDNGARPRGGWPLLASLFAFGSVLGSVLRFGPRDGIQLLAPVFYATPPAVIAAMAVLAFLLVCKRSGMLRLGTGLLAVVQLWVLCSGWQTAEPVPGPIKLGFWNVSSGGLGWDPITSQIRSWDADIIGLAESNLHFSTDDPAARRKYWKQRFDGYNVIRFPRGMRLITKYPAEEISKGKLALRSNYGIARVQIGEQTVHVVMADLLSGPRLPRGPSFVALMKLVRDLPPGPVVLMGDMNTPTESVHIDDLREGFRNAFEEKGTGFYHSWPMPFPVLPLDQVWVNEGFEVGSCDLQWTTRSDHRPMVVTLTLKP